jgi:hypothetical protein
MWHNKLGAEGGKAIAKAIMVSKFICLTGRTDEPQ